MKSFSAIDFCLLIPCYNNFPGLISSLKSVEYSSGNFLVLVIDDGSQDAVSLERINESLETNKPVIVINNDKNIGITATLNKGLSWIEENTDAKYIARLDCGDICSKDRFELQVKYMDRNPATGLTGSWCRIVDADSSFSYSYIVPLQHQDIRKAMYFRNVFMHATVMFRTSVLKQAGYYPTNFEYAEDYAFFWKLTDISTSYIFDQFLVVCELNKEGISYKNKSKQVLARARVIKTFGSNIVLKIAAYIRLCILFILPRAVALKLKKGKG